MLQVFKILLGITNTSRASGNDVLSEEDLFLEDAAPGSKRKQTTVIKTEMDLELSGLSARERNM